MPTPAEDAKVYVTGEVAQPGVYEIAPGDRVIDVVTRAGGLTPEAEALRINLAVRLRDECMCISRLVIARRRTSKGRHGRCR